MRAETALLTAASVPAELLPHTQSGCNHNTALRSCKLTQKESKERDLLCFFTKRAWGEKFLPSRHAQQAQSSYSPKTCCSTALHGQRRGETSVSIWGNTSTIARRGYRDKKMQYRLHWHVVPLTRSFPPSPVFGNFQYHRAQGDAQAMKISQCISKDF